MERNSGTKSWFFSDKGFNFNVTILVERQVVNADHKQIAEIIHNHFIDISKNYGLKRNLFHTSQLLESTIHMSRLELANFQIINSFPISLKSLKKMEVLPFKKYTLEEGILASSGKWTHLGISEKNKNFFIRHCQKK